MGYKMVKHITIIYKNIWNGIIGLIRRIYHGCAI